MTKTCVIVGAGPAGMAAALYLKRLGIDPIIVDKNSPGGEMLKIYNLENYLGFENINGADLSLKMVNQLKNLGVRFVYGQVKDIIKKDKFLVKLDNKEIEADNVIIATGKISNKLGLKNEDEFIGKGISYCAICDGNFYKDKDVAVIGGGNTAFTDALYLSDLCDKVYVIVRNKVRADEILQSKVKEKENIILIKGSTVKEIIVSDKIDGVVLDNDRVIDVSGLFIAIGGKPNLDFISNLKIETENGFIKTDKNMMTNIKGIYAAGDVVIKDFYQIITAINDGVIAALNIGKEN